MKNVPTKIFLQVGNNEFMDDVDFNELAEVSWCKDKIYENDIEYTLQNKSDIPLEWSPVESEKKWQQEQFRKMFPSYENDQPDWQRLNFFIEAGLKFLNKSVDKVSDNQVNFIQVLEENYQAQIAGYYNFDKTDEEKKIRNAVIEEYKDLIAIYKSKLKQKVSDISAEEMINTIYRRHKVDLKNPQFDIATVNEMIYDALRIVNSAHSPINH